MDEPSVLFERQENIGLLSLNRPDRRNAMGPELLDDFGAALEQVRASEGLRALVITGRGRSFCVGADLSGELQREDDSRLPHQRSYAMYEPFLGLLEVPIPILAALNGHAVGGGFGLALLADLRVAALGARYGANFARLGISSGLAISYLLPRLIGLPRASEMLFTGKLITGEQGEQMGLMNAAVPADRVLEHTLAMAREIGAAAPIAVQSMKAALRRGLDWRVREAALQEACVQAETLSTQDAAEGIAALLAKREPHFLGR